MTQTKVVEQPHFSAAAGEIVFGGFAYWQYGTDNCFAEQMPPAIERLGDAVFDQLGRLNALGPVVTRESCASTANHLEG